MFIFVKSYHLVGGLEHVFFTHIGNVIIPVDFHIFQRGRSTTNQSWSRVYTDLDWDFQTGFNHSPLILVYGWYYIALQWFGYAILTQFAVKHHWNIYIYLGLQKIKSLVSTPSVYFFWMLIQKVDVLVDISINIKDLGILKSHSMPITSSSRSHSMLLKSRHQITNDFPTGGRWCSFAWPEISQL